MINSPLICVATEKQSLGYLCKFLFAEYLHGKAICIILIHSCVCSLSYLPLLFIFMTLRHWTWFSDVWFGQVWLWTLTQSASTQVLARCHRGGNMIRAESHPGSRTVERVLLDQGWGDRLGRESWSDCNWCCHVTLWIWDQSSKGWNSLYKDTAVH